MLGWLMTFLDAVDRKLARDCRFGDVLHHGLDIIQWPLWVYSLSCGADRNVDCSA
jgi:hypothetical protein